MSDYLPIVILCVVPVFTHLFVGLFAYVLGRGAYRIRIERQQPSRERGKRGKRSLKSSPEPPISLEDTDTFTVTT